MIFQNLNRLDLIGDPIRIGNHDLMAFFFAQERSESSHHLLSRTEMLVGIWESFPHFFTTSRVERVVTTAKGFLGDIDITKNLILRIHVMAVAGRANGFL